VDFTVGLLALAVGLAFDYQRLIPAIGDRIAAICALTVGAAWLSGGNIGGWFDDAADVATESTGAALNQVTGDVPASSGQEILGIAIGFLFLLWLLAVLPAIGFLSKHASPNVSGKLTSGLIWLGVVFPPLIGLVPGRWGDLATNVTFAGVRLGRTVSDWILG
jgi:hypothetical protein